MSPFEEVRQTWNRIPHWQQGGGKCYFLTFRLADSLPEELLAEWQRRLDAWKERHPHPWSPEVSREYYQIFREPEKWLDLGHGSGALREPTCQNILKEVLTHFEGVQYHHFCWVIMPNHVHSLTQLLDQYTLESVVGAWKSVSAHRINKATGRSGKLWQDSYWDTLIRNESHWENCVLYIRENARKAGRLAKHFEDEAMSLIQ